MKTVVNRLKRLEGQLARLREDIEGTHKSADVIPQLLAAKGAMNALTEEYLILALKDCASGSCPKDTALVLETVIKKL